MSMFQMQWYRSTDILRKNSTLINPQLGAKFISFAGAYVRTESIMPLLGQLVQLELLLPATGFHKISLSNEALSSSRNSPGYVLIATRKHYERAQIQNPLLLRTRLMHGERKISPLRTSSLNINMKSNFYKSIKSVYWNLYVAFHNLSNLKQINNLALVHPSNHHFVKCLTNSAQSTTSFALDLSHLRRQGDAGFQLLVSLFYARIRLFCFGRHEFRHHVLALNGQNASGSFAIGRNVSSFFYFRPARFSIAAREFFRAFARQQALFLILDCHYHAISVEYFYKNRAFTMAALTLSFDNGKITYVLPVVINNFLSHYFVILFVLEARRTAEGALFVQTQTCLLNLHTKISNQILAITVHNCNYINARS